MKKFAKILISTLLMLMMLLSVVSCGLGDDSEEFYIDGPASITMQVGETVTLEVVKPDNLKGKVDWIADDDFVFVEDGVVVAAAEGITVVRATLGNYSDKVIVTVTSPKNNTGNNNTGNNNNDNNNTGNNNTGNDNTGSGTTAGLLGTIDFSTNAQRVSLDTASQVWQNGNVKLTNNQASSVNSVADYVGPVRFYPASDVIIECNGMTKIVIVCDNTYKDSTGALSDAVSGTGVTATVDGDVLTITFSSAVNSFTFSAIPSQARISSLEVYGG